MPKDPRLLLVDDEPDMVRGLRRILRTRGYQVDVAINGKEAIVKAHENEPDGILMDIKIPDINGIETYRQIREFCPNSFVIFMTAYSDLMSEASAEFPIEILPKPLDMKKLHSLIENAIITRPVIIVDDDRDFGQSLSRNLENKGFDVRCCIDEAEAMEFFRKCPRSVVLLDMALGTANGLDILKKLKQRNPKRIVILLTGYPEMERKMISGLGHSARACFNKPFEIDQLVSCIHNAIKSPSQN